MIDLRYNINKYTNKIELNWVNTIVGNNLYRVFRKNISDDKEAVFTQVSIFNDLDSNDDISILNIHPNCGKDITYTDSTGKEYTIKESEILRKWILETNEESETGYGLDKVRIDSVTISEFNDFSFNYLYAQDGSAKYDAICIGFYTEVDYTSTEQVFTTDSLNYLRDYINKGYGVLVGHSAIGSLYGTNIGLGRIRDSFGITLGQWDYSQSGFDYPYKVSVSSSKIIKNNKNQILYYPWLVDEDETIEISNTYTNAEFTEGNIILKFDDPDIIGKSYLDNTMLNKCNFYLTRYKSTIVTQIGCDLNIKEAEKKILANAIFSLKAVTKDRAIKDNYFVDNNIPNVPAMVNQYIETDSFTSTFDYRAQDNGVDVQYYVEAFDLNSGDIQTSNTIEIKYYSNIKYYEYVLNRINSDIKIEEELLVAKGNTTERMYTTDTLKKGYYCFNIRSVDNAYNKSGYCEVIFYIPGEVISEPSKAEIRYPNAKKINHRYRGPQESMKLDTSSLQYSYNINKLKEIYNTLENEKLNLLTKPESSINIISRLEDIIKSIDDNMREKR